VVVRSISDVVVRSISDVVVRSISDVVVRSISNCVHINVFNPKNSARHHLVQHSMITAPKHSFWMRNHCIKAVCNHSEVTALTKCYETFIPNRNHLII